MGKKTFGVWFKIFKPLKLDVLLSVWQKLGFASAGGFVTQDPLS